MGIDQRISDCCGFVVVTFDWATENGQNHRAHEGELVCTGCGKGLKVTPEDYAATLAKDREWDKRVHGEKLALGLAVSASK